MRALRVLQPFMFATGLAFHGAMLARTYGWGIPSALPLAGRLTLLALSALGLFAAIHAHRAVHRGPIVGRIKGFVSVLGLSFFAVAIHLVILLEIIELDP